MKLISLRPAQAIGIAFVFAACCTVSSTTVFAVLLPDAGGTAQLPLLSDHVGQSPMQINAGLPPATTIDIAALWKAPLLYEEIPGGSLGGTQAGGGGTLFNWTMTGTGALAGFNRVINMPGASALLSFPATPPLDTQAGFEIHAAPRMLGDPLQCFDTALFRLFSQITGDPDFDLLRVVAGNDFGLPSPGHTNLLQNGSFWEAYSYYDVTYRIDFVGRAGGVLGGMSGSSTGTVRFVLGDPIPCIPEPASAFMAIVGIAAGAMLRRRAPRS